MSKPVRTAAVMLALALLPAVGTGAASAAGRSTAMGMNMVTVTVTAGRLYRVTLVIGPLEPMYTLAQYQRLHPRSGEVMLRGTMMMGGSGMAMLNRHLELHVLDLSTMRPVTNAMVTISYQPVVPRGAMAVRPTQVPVAVMTGIGMGVNDVHFGNNVAMPPGTYHVYAHINAAYVYYTVYLT